MTGATGLLGNNLVRLLTQRGFKVKALARSPQKAQRQLADAGAVAPVARMVLTVR